MSLIGPLLAFEKNRRNKIKENKKSHHIIGYQKSLKPMNWISELITLRELGFRILNILVWMLKDLG